MKASTRFRRAVCVAATALVLTTGAGCRGPQGVDEGIRVGTKLDDALRPGTNAGPRGKRNGPSPDQWKYGADVACKANEQRTGTDSPLC